MWPLKKMYISCTDPSCHNWFPDFLVVRQNSFTTAYPMNCQNKLVWQLGSVHKIHIHLEATSPFNATWRISKMLCPDFPVVIFLFVIYKGSIKIKRWNSFFIPYGLIKMWSKVSLVRILKLPRAGLLLLCGIIVEFGGFDQLLGRCLQGHKHVKV